MDMVWTDGTFGWMWMFGWPDHRSGPVSPGTQVNSVCNI